MGRTSEKTEQAKGAASDAQDYAGGKARDAQKYARDSAEYAQAKAGEAADQGASTWQKVKDAASHAYNTVRARALQGLLFRCVCKRALCSVSNIEKYDYRCASDTKHELAFPDKYWFLNVAEIL